MQDERDNLWQKRAIAPVQSGYAPAGLLYLEPLGSQNQGDSNLIKTWAVIRRSLGWIAIMVLAGAVLGLLWSRREKPVYQARVSLEIENPSENVFRVGSVGIQSEGMSSPPESYLATQILILQSRTLRDRAIARTGNVGTPLDVKIRVEPTSRIAQILCDSNDARFAADYANAIANEYIESDLQAHWNAFNGTRVWLTHQLEESRTKLQKSENELQAYARKSHLIFSGGQSQEQNKLKEIEDELVRAEADRVQKQSTNRVAHSSRPDWVPMVMDNPSLTDYRNQIAALRKQIAELSLQFTPEYYKTRRLQSQIEELQVGYQKAREDVLGRIQSEYQGALMREKLLAETYKRQAQAVDEQSQKTITYNILQRDVDTNRQLYASLLQQSKEADATALRGSNMRIVDSAQVPKRPYKPNMVNNMLLGALAGLCLGTGLILVRESLDRSFRGPGELSFHLKLPELGVIPAGSLVLSNGHSKVWNKHSLPTSTGQPTPGAQSVELVTWRDKSSAIAESFRNALVSILCAPQAIRPRVILVTSALRAEGKTTIVTNLGIALAEINQRVLLVDGDLRRPRLNKVFNLGNDWGLSDLLREKTSLRDCPLEAFTKRTEMPDLAVLTSGPSTNNISNLLYSTRMFDLLQRLRQEFDFVLVDTPPMLDIADARILAHHADAVILVCRAGKTSRDAALAAKQRMSDDGIQVLGTILNGWDVKNMHGYGASRYEYQSF